MTSFRMDASGRLVFGSVGTLDGTGAATHTTWAARKIRRLFPQLREVAFEAAWHGRIAMTEGHVPRFHALAPRMIAVHGYNGRGIAPGTMFGRLLAEVVLGRPEAMPLPAEPVRPARLRAARAALYARGGAGGAPGGCAGDRRCVLQRAGAVPARNAASNSSRIGTSGSRGRGWGGERKGAWSAMPDLPLARGTGLAPSRLMVQYQHVVMDRAEQKTPDKRRNHQ
jgi:hypothetical protein